MQGTAGLLCLKKLGTKSLWLALDFMVPNQLLEQMWSTAFLERRQRRYQAASIQKERAFAEGATVAAPRAVSCRRGANAKDILAASCKAAIWVCSVWPGVRVRGACYKKEKQTTKPLWSLGWPQLGHQIQCFLKHSLPGVVQEGLLVSQKTFLPRMRRRIFFKHFQFI